MLLNHFHLTETVLTSDREKEFTKKRASFILPSLASLIRISLSEFSESNHNFSFENAFLLSLLTGEKTFKNKKEKRERAICLSISQEILVTNQICLLFS